MKRDDMDIDEILKHYLPRASQEEVDEASEIVLSRIRSMRFQPANALLKAVKKPPKAEWLNDIHLAVLIAVEQLQGQGRPATITQRVEELLEVSKAPGSAVLALLRMMERSGLVSSSPVNPQEPDAVDKTIFQNQPIRTKNDCQGIGGPETPRHEPPERSRIVCAPNKDSGESVTGPPSSDVVS